MAYIYRFNREATRAVSPFQTEENLLRQISDGDEHAFRVLFDQYRDFIYSFALHITNSELIAKDIVQDIFIKIWMQRHTLHEISNIKGYMHRLTRNHALNGLKRKAHELSLLQTLPVAASLHTTEETLLYRELERLLDKAVSLLPPQQQRVYQLSRKEGLTHAEIADRLHISTETVKKHLMAALRSIRIYLQQHGSGLYILAICIAEIAFL